jgi:hypothetical protein
MLWTTTAETQVINGIEYRNVWGKNDPDVIRDASALGTRVTPPGRAVAPWAEGLCVVAYDGPTLVAIAPGEIRFVPRVKAKMALLRVYVEPSHRERGLVVPLTLKSHEVIREYARQHPEERIGGTMGLVTAKGVVDEPVTKAFMQLIGYSPRGEPLLVRWFEGFKI